MSAHKKIHLVPSNADKSSAYSGSRQPSGNKLAKEKFDLKISLRERTRLMLGDPETQTDHHIADADAMQSPISDLYRTLHSQSIQTTQMCMDAELRAISAIEERVTTELRLIEADYECIAMELRARQALADRLHQAEKDVAIARAKENSALNNFDAVKPATGTNDGELLEQQLQALAQKRLNAEIRSNKMQNIRMDAEQCAIQEIEFLVEDEELASSDFPEQFLSEKFILQMALENGQLATQVNSHAAQVDSQARNIDETTEAKWNLDFIHTSGWPNLFMESPTIH